MITNYSLPEWVGVVLYLNETEFADPARILHLAENIETFSVVAPFGPPAKLRSVNWIKDDDEKVNAWNRYLEKSSKPYVLFLEDDEKIINPEVFSHLSPSASSWTAVFIKVENNDGRKTVYQNRFVAGGEKIFDGKRLPDASRFFLSRDIEQSGHIIALERKSDLLSQADLEEELGCIHPSLQTYLAEGERHLQNKKYAHAAAQYRKLLKEPKLLAFDRLAAVNGLTACFTEQYKWDQAIMLAEKSISAEPQQRMPYLILFRIYQLLKQWDKALKALKGYYQYLNGPSLASFDKGINEEETLQKMAELAQNTGLKKQALYYLEQIYSLKKGDVENDFLKHVLILSVELSEFEKAALYFRQLFGNKIPDKMNEKEKEDLNVYLKMFMKKGWSQFAADIYELLFLHEPDNDTYRRRLIVSLSKMNRLEQARKLVSG